MAIATTLGLILMLVSTAVKVTSPTASPTTDNDTLQTAEVTSQPPCPELDGVYSERGEQEVNICWTLRDNWKEVDAKYEIHFQLPDNSTVVIDHEGVDLQCHVVAYEAIALKVNETIEYKVTVTWRECGTASRGDTTTRRAPPTPRPDPLTAAKAGVGYFALAMGAITVALVLTVALAVHCHRKRSRKV